MTLNLAVISTITIAIAITLIVVVIEKFFNNGAKVNALHLMPISKDSNT